MTIDKKMTLAEIGDEMYALNDLLQEIGGDVTDEQAEAAVMQWLDDNKANLHIKLDDYGKLINFRTMMREHRKAEVKRIKTLGQTDDNIITTLKNHLRQFFNAQKIKKIETTSFKFWVQGAGGMQAMTIVEDIKLNFTPPGPSVDPDFVPARYRCTVTTSYLDNQRVREDLELLQTLKEKQAKHPDSMYEFEISKIQELEELLDFAHLEPRGQNLMIK